MALSEDVISHAQNMADVTAMKRVNLLPTGGSYLGPLVQSCIGINNEFSVDQMTNAAKQLHMTNGSHEEQESALVAKVSKFTVNILNTARNTVVPEVKDLLEAVATAEKQKAEQINDHEYTIEMVEVPVVFSDGYFIESVTRRALVQQRDVGDITDAQLSAAYAFINTVRSTLPKAEVDALALTGDPTLDEKLSKYYGERSFSKASNDSLNPRRSKDDLLRYIAVDGILNGRNTVVTDMLTDEDVRLSLIRLRNQLSVKVYRLSEDFKASVSSGNITVKPKVYEAISSVAPNIPGRVVIYVHGPRYRTWLKEQGSTEALLGAAIQNAGNEAALYLGYVDKALKEDPESLVKTYTDTLRTNLVKSESQFPKIVTRTLRDYGNKNISEIHESETDRKRIQMAFNDLLRNPIKGREELRNYVLKAVICVHGLSDDVCYVLEQMELASTESEAVAEDKEELLVCARIIATSRLIGKWLASQTTVETGGYSNFKDVMQTSAVAISLGSRVMKEVLSSYLTPSDKLVTDDLIAAAYEAELGL